VGTNVHVVALRRRGEPRDTVDVVCSLADGNKLAIHPVIGASEGELVKVAFTRKSCFCLVTRGTERKEYFLYRYDLDGKPAQPVPGCPAITFGSIHAMSVFAESGPYVALQFSGAVPWHRDVQTGVVILREDDPSWIFVTGCIGKEGEVSPMPGFIRGERYYDAVSKAGAVRVFDLKSGRLLASGSIPSWPAPEPRSVARITDFRLAGNALVVLSAVWDVRADVFDAETCAHKGGQVLDGVDYTRWPQRERNEGGMVGPGQWENEMTEGSGMLLVTDRSGLQVLVPSERVEASTALRSFPKLYRRREPIVADGSLQEWGQDEHVELPLRDADGKPASLLLAQDGRNLFAAVSYEDARVDALRGEGVYNDGDWITVEQGQGPSARIGQDPGGNLIDKPEPDNRGRMIYATGGIGHDLRTLRHIYELVLPLARTRTWAQGVLSLKVFDERGLGGPARIIKYDNVQIGYYPFTREEEDATFALIRELPDLRESRRLYAQLRGIYDAWSLKMPPYPSTNGPVDPARAVESLLKYVSVIKGVEPFPYAFYKHISRFGGDEALPPEFQEWSKRKAKIEARRQGPYPLNESLYVTNWLVLGPFPTSGGGGFDYLKHVGGEAPYVPDHDTEIATGVGGRAKWVPYASPRNEIDFFAVQHFGLADKWADAVVYVACWLKADRDTDCELQLGTDDGYRFYLDHELPEADHVWREGIMGEARFKVSLAKGLHLLLIQFHGNVIPPGANSSYMQLGLFGFRLRVTDPSGGRPPDVTVWN
ncbi:MAG: hypothetical protein WCK05_12405, partial [Planctomycetota bacterium]